MLKPLKLLKKRTKQEQKYLMSKHSTAVVNEQKVRGMQQVIRHKKIEFRDGLVDDTHVDQ